MNRALPCFAAAIAACTLAAPAQTQRGAAPQAELDCKPTRQHLVYDCTLRLARRDGSPLAGVPVSIGADMPSMPMAHNVKPVEAQPGAAPGEYHARLELEMQGVWAVKLRLGKPANDLLVLHYRFDERGASPQAGALQR